MIDSSADLLLKLHSMGLISGDRFPFWWPGYGTWIVLVTAILTQQSQWRRVEQSVNNLFAAGLDSSQKLLSADWEVVARAIAPSGLYNQKSRRVVKLFEAMKADYGTFEDFARLVTREWLLEREGVGYESADAILCYACKRPVIAADRYAAKLLALLGRETEGYEETQNYLNDGVKNEFSRIEKVLGLSLEATCAYFHGAIVEFMRDKQDTDTKIARLMSD